MTRAQFVAKALRAMERSLGIPSGWWGTWNDVTDGLIRVNYSRGGGWRISRSSGEISRHDSRSYAIVKAVRMSREKKVKP